jgi:hypothetical protein
MAGRYRLEPHEAAAHRAWWDELTSRVPVDGGYAPPSLADFECIHGRCATDPVRCGCYIDPLDLLGTLHYHPPMLAADDREAVSATREREL